MSDLPILTPSECATLAAIEAKMTRGDREWEVYDDGFKITCFGTTFSASIYGNHAEIRANAIGIVELRNAAPRMLATTAVLREQLSRIASLPHERICDLMERSGKLSDGTPYECAACIAGKALTGREPDPLADDLSRCAAVCGWPLVPTSREGCVRGNCSMRPRPDRLYSPARAEVEEWSADGGKPTINRPPGVKD